MKPASCWSPGLACLAVWLAGCGGNSVESYVPQSDSAKEALQLALDAWKGGQSADPVGKSPSGATIRAIDMDWAAGDCCPMRSRRSCRSPWNRARAGSPSS